MYLHPMYSHPYFVLASARDYYTTMANSESIKESLLAADLVNRLQVERGYTTMLVSSQYNNSIAEENMDKAR